MLAFVVVAVACAVLMVNAGRASAVEGLGGPTPATDVVAVHPTSSEPSAPSGSQGAAPEAAEESGATAAAIGA